MVSWCFEVNLYSPARRGKKEEKSAVEGKDMDRKDVGLCLKNADSGTCSFGCLVVGWCEMMEDGLE